MKNYRKPYKIKKKKSILKSRFFWSAILILAIFIGIFYFIFFHSFFQIKTIEVSGFEKTRVSFLDPAEVSSNEKAVAENLEALVVAKTSRQILFFPSRSIFLVDFGKISREILRNFPHLSEVKLKRKLPGTLFLQVKEREAVAVFDKEDNSFLVDKEGIIFDFLESETEEQSFIKFKKADDKEVNLRDKVISKDQLSKILEAEAKLKNDLNILAEEIMVVSEVRFDIKTPERFKIYFNFQEDLDWQITKLRAVLEEEFPPGERGNLEYIDIRFGSFAVPVPINR